MTDITKEKVMDTLQAVTKMLYEYACQCEVGDERTRAFNLYEIVRTAPREANKL